MTVHNVNAITEEPGVFGCGTRPATAAGEATGHVRRAGLARQSWTSRAGAANASEAETDAQVYRRIVSRIPAIPFRPGDLGEHVGLSAAQLDASLGRLIARGLLVPGATSERCEVLTDSLIEAVDE